MLRLLEAIYSCFCFRPHFPIQLEVIHASVIMHITILIITVKMMVLIIMHGGLEIHAVVADKHGIHRAQIFVDVGSVVVHDGLRPDQESQQDREHRCKCGEHARFCHRFHLLCLSLTLI